MPSFYKLKTNHYPRYTHTASLLVGQCCIIFCVLRKMNSIDSDKLRIVRNPTGAGHREGSELDINAWRSSKDG